MSKPKLNIWNGISESTEFDEKYFLDMDMSYSDTGDTQKACHTAGLGSITILDRLTGFEGYVRDVETGYRDKHGEFWLASGDFNILEKGCKTFGEAIALIKSNANNCIGKEHEDKFPIQRAQRAEARVKELENAICRVRGTMVYMAKDDKPKVDCIRILQDIISEEVGE